ncbi:hypothetical protein [Gordonia sp. SID5947]|uniref:hypothetical protein n=1 Tax=Gordonia sp. SID5947 TaxID=2690315 RepID=UPI0031BB7C72
MSAKSWTGPPMVIGASAVSVATVAMSVASVGPYPFRISRPGAHRRTRSALTASPPTPSIRRPVRRSGVRVERTVGVSSAWVTPACVMTSASSSGVSPGAATTRVADADSAEICSPTAMSKLGEVLCRNRVPVVTR